ncbi:J domain-containing protein [Rhodococcus sp. NPDC004095]
MEYRPEREDWYQVLGVDPSASQDQIGHAFRRLIRAHHPDTRFRSDPVEDECLGRIIAAYRVLRDSRRRTEYDRDHPDPAPVTPARSTGTPVDIPVTQKAADARRRSPLWAGPVRFGR